VHIMDNCYGLDTAAFLESAMHSASFPNHPPLEIFVDDVQTLFKTTVFRGNYLGALIYEIGEPCTKCNCKGCTCKKEEGLCVAP
ncbi:hypothetical protein TELCIR_08835, partial [Teladorsagia circumcincta]